MASSKEWFESVAEAQRRAKRRLPRSVYLALVAGGTDGTDADRDVDFEPLDALLGLASAGETVLLLIEGIAAATPAEPVALEPAPWDRQLLR